MKQLKVNVDVLTLTATPIPRTLEMSLVGIRDLSLLQTPPADRQPILTYVGGYDERVAVEAIRRELLREGQVFWVHNRVRSIEHAAARLRELVPEARIAVAHGQMDEGTLEQVVVDFWDGQFDVLVCTTIIESGIDMPTVNTLVVERSDLLGLGQLHQLRGRVGRSGQRAYAYLFHPVDVDAHRGGLRAAEDDRRGHRARQRVQDRDARPRDPRRRQPARRGPVGPHRGRRLRPVLPDGHRGGRRDEGRADPAAGRDQARRARPTPSCPADYVAKEELRLEAYRRLAGVTTHGRRSTTSAPSGRTATARCRAPAEALLHGRLPARRVPPPRASRDIVDLVGPGPPGAARAQAQPDDAAAPARPRRDLQGGRPPARRADPAAQEPAEFLVGFLRELVAAGRAGVGGRAPVGSAPVSFAAVKRALAAVTAVVAALALSSCGAVESTTTAADGRRPAVTVDQFAGASCEALAANADDTGSIEDPTTGTIAGDTAAGRASTALVQARGQRAVPRRPRRADHRRRPAGGAGVADRRRTTRPDDVAAGRQSTCSATTAGPAADRRRIADAG